jgi:cytochrome bd-type quinol oxidase subunit 1
MGNFLTSFLFALGVSAWVYNKVQQRNGGLAQRSLIAAGVVGVMALLVFFTVISSVSSKFN